jgi:hypothetical protein
MTDKKETSLENIENPEPEVVLKDIDTEDLKSLILNGLAGLEGTLYKEAATISHSMEPLTDSISKLEDILEDRLPYLETPELISVYGLKLTKRKRDQDFLLNLQKNYNTSLDSVKKISDMKKESDKLSIVSDDLDEDKVAKLKSLLRDKIKKKTNEISDG